MEKEIDPLPSRGYRLARIGLLFIGALALVWLPIEDRSPLSAQLLVAAFCLAGGLLRLFRHPTRPRGRLRMAGAGMLAGLAVPPLAVLLLIFKNGLHSHSGPDYSPALLVALLEQTPLWGLGGALIAAGLAPLFAKH